MRKGLPVAEVVLSPEAASDLYAIFDYILAEDGLDAAEMVVLRLEKAITSLAFLSERGKRPLELQDLGITQFLEIQCPPWRIFYRLGKGTVQVLAVLDGRRDIASLLQERMLR